MANPALSPELQEMYKDSRVVLSADCDQIYIDGNLVASILPLSKNWDGITPRFLAVNGSENALLCDTALWFLAGRATENDLFNCFKLALQES
jgi:hypothetical protein